MDQILFLFITTALIITSFTIIALVAIAHRQEDIAALALKFLSQTLGKEPAKDQEAQKQD